MRGCIRKADLSGLRVLHVIPSVASSDGGPARAIELMERALSAAGVSVTTLTTDHGGGGNDVPASKRIYKRLWTTPYKLAPGMVPYLWRHLHEFDVVHIHAMFSFAPTAAALCARLLGVPYVVRPLGTLGQYGLLNRRPLLKRLSTAAIEGPILRHASAIHFTSAEEAEEARAMGTPMRGVVIPLGVDTVDSPSSQAVAELRHRIGDRHPILFLSRLDPKKNLEGLIDAFSGSPMLMQTCALVIAGDGDAGYGETLRSRAVSAGLGDVVHWLGHVEGPQKAAALSIAELFALPSHSENFGIAAVEAMLAGLPCVLGEGIAIARGAATGGAALATAPDVPAVRNALEELMKNAPVRREMGARAAAYARERYSPEAMARELVSLYRDIAQRPTGGESRGGRW